MKKINSSVKNLLDKYIILKNKKNEIRKYRDKRRVDIYSKVSLTDSQQNEINEIFLNNYGKKVSSVWHRHYTAFTGNFDKYYFPELFYEF